MIGRPQISEEEYQRWLDAMSPYLLHGQSLNYAIEKAGIGKHRTSVYEKYAQKDWFSDKIDHLQATIGELTNIVAFKVIERAHAKLVQDPNYILNSNEVRMVILVATKHRSSQPFFVTRKEINRSAKKDIGRIIETPTINYISTD